MALDRKDVKHIILIKLIAAATKDVIDRFKQSFEFMPTKIEGVSSDKWGFNDSSEAKIKKYYLWGINKFFRWSNKNIGTNIGTKTKVKIK